MSIEEYVAQLLEVAPPITDAQAEQAARILVTVGLGDAA